MQSKEQANTQAMLFTVGTAPFIHNRVVVSSLMRDFAIALLPALCFATLQYGFVALRAVALAIAVCVISEYLCCRITKQKVRLYDTSAIITAILFSFLIPPYAPWWIICFGSIIAIFLGKYAFGGIGTNPLCIPLVAWAFLFVSWPEYLDAHSVVLNGNFIEPLHLLKYFGASSLEGVSPWALLTGSQLGGLGTVYVGALLLGGLYLVLRRVVAWEIPFSFLFAVLIFGSLLYSIDPQRYISPELYFLTGTTVFAAFFLASDYASSPSGRLSMLLFGFLGGLLCVLIRNYSVYVDGALFAVLLANLCTPLLDLLRRVPFGGSK